MSETQWHKIYEFITILNCYKLLFNNITQFYIIITTYNNSQYHFMIDIEFYNNVYQCIKIRKDLKLNKVVWTNFWNIMKLTAVKPHRFSDFIFNLFNRKIENYRIFLIIKITTCVIEMSILYTNMVYYICKSCIHILNFVCYVRFSSRKTQHH